MSDIQSRFGSSATKLRSTRSQATRTPCTRIVVLPLRRRCEPEKPVARISRSARLPPIRTPWRRSSACTRGDPYVSRLRLWIARICSTSQASWSARCKGARRSQAWKPARDSPSRRHSSETGWLAFSARMKRKHLTGSRSPSRRRPQLSQHLALLAQHAILAPQPAQLLPLLTRHALTLARVDPGLPHPHPQRLARDAEIAGDLSQRPAAAPIELDRLTPKLRRIRPLEIRSLWHGGASFLPDRTLPTKRSGVHQDGGTPDCRVRPALASGEATRIGTRPKSVGGPPR